LALPLLEGFLQVYRKNQIQNLFIGEVKMIEKSDKKKIQYVKPMLLDLDNVNSMLGQCDNGASDSVTCYAYGSGAGTVCNSLGTGPGTECYHGESAGQDCSWGNSPVWGCDTGNGD
jgi:hypothetical protein